MSAPDSPISSPAPPLSSPPGGLDHVDTWVFDLDNTLYPASAPVMAQVETRMTEFIMRIHEVEAEEAGRIRDRYWADYGTTLNGLMVHDRVDIGDFLDFVHDIDHSVITPDEGLAGRIAGLEGKRYVYTNGSMKHAERVIDRLGLNGVFDDLFDIEAAQYLPKPQREAFERFGKRFGVTAANAAMFEDCARNLQTAHALGYTTVLIHPAGGPAPSHPHVHFTADDLRAFLGDAARFSRKAQP